MQVSVDEIMLLLNKNPETMKTIMNSAKQNYVEEHHKRKLTHMKDASGYKKGKWKTYVGKKRKEIVRGSKEKLIDDYAKSLNVGIEEARIILDA